MGAGVRERPPSAYVKDVLVRPDAGHDNCILMDAWCKRALGGREL